VVADQAPASLHKGSPRPLSRDADNARELKSTWDLNPRVKCTRPLVLQTLDLLPPCSHARLFLSYSPISHNVFHWYVTPAQPLHGHTAKNINTPTNTLPSLQKTAPSSSPAPRAPASQLSSSASPPSTPRTLVSAFRTPPAGLALAKRTAASTTLSRGKTSDSLWTPMGSLSTRSLAAIFTARVCRRSRM
jgi:hypothetical protein